MAWYHPYNFDKKKPYLLKRMALVKAVRSYFDNLGFLEVETPILQVCPTMDTHIHGFKTELLNLDRTYKADFYLHTSPEFAMKKLMVAGIEQLYQICHVFRNAEGSRLHSPEFTMIEWYRAHAGYEEIMADCINLFRHCAKELDISHYEFQGKRCDPFAEWQKITVEQAFKQMVNINLSDYLEDISAFARVIKERGIGVADDDRWDDLFFRVMAEKIEPHLGMEVPCILYDYPASMASLSRKKPSDKRYAERFELYVCGIELANAFGELTDTKEQRERFMEEMITKESLYGERYPIDEEFLEALAFGLPESGGIALGIDRLAMLASGAEDIKDVLWSEV